MTDFSCRDIAQMIDHALLAPTLTADELQAGCEVALQHQVASVCTMPFHLSQCVQALAGSSVRASTTIGFPHGVQTTSIKRAEAEQALLDGGQELDLVINPSRALSGDWGYIRDEIAAVLEPTRAAGQKLKVIFETCYLNQQQKLQLCRIANELQIDHHLVVHLLAPVGQRHRVKCEVDHPLISELTRLTQLRRLRSGDCRRSVGVEVSGHDGTGCR